jgi:hypothetical protein
MKLTSDLDSISMEFEQRGSAWLAMTCKHDLGDTLNVYII